MADKDIWSFELVLDKLREAVDLSYSIKRINLNSDIKYDGPELTSSSLLSGYPGVTESLTAEWLESSLEHGRDAMGEILMSALRLGIEQGFRMARRESERNTMSKHVRMYIEDGTGDKEWALTCLSSMEDGAKNPGGIK